MFSFLKSFFVVLGHILLINEVMLMFTKTLKDVYLVSLQTFDHMVL